MELRVREDTILTEYRDGDADALFRHLRSGEVGRTIPALPSPYSHASAERFLEARLRELAETSAPASLAIRATGGPLIGAIGVEAPSADDAEWGELGYWLAPELWGRGIMGAALPCFLEYAASRLSLRLITGRTLVTNRASLRLLEANGFTALGVRGGLPDTGEAGREVAYFGLKPARSSGVDRLQR